MGNGGYIGAMASCLLLSLTITTLRFYIRAVPIKHLSPSEYVVILSQVLQASLVIGNISFLALSTDESVPIPAKFKLFFTTILLYFGCLWSIKVSVNLLYLRLSHGSRLYYIAIALMIYVNACGIVITMLQLFSCWPLQRRFNPHDLCYSPKTNPVFWASAVLNITSEVLLFLFPFLLVKKITNRSLQVALAVVFTMGFLVIAADLVSVVLTYEAPALNVRIVLLITIIETTVAMIVSALPGLSRAFLRHRQVQSNRTLTERHEEAAAIVRRREGRDGQPATQDATTLKRSEEGKMEQTDIYSSAEDTGTTF